LISPNTFHVGQLDGDGRAATPDDNKVNQERRDFAKDDRNQHGPEHRGLSRHAQPDLGLHDDRDAGQKRHQGHKTQGLNACEQDLACEHRAGGAWPVPRPGCLPEDTSQHGKEVRGLPHSGDGVLTNRPAECHGHLPVRRQAQFRPNIVDHFQHAPAVCDVYFGGVQTVLGVRIVEDRAHVWFNRNAAIIAAREKVLENAGISPWPSPG